MLAAAPLARRSPADGWRGPPASGAGPLACKAKPAFRRASENNPGSDRLSHAMLPTQGFS